jgi:ankyrin repeat protein
MAFAALVQAAAGVEDIYAWEKQLIEDPQESSIFVCALIGHTAGVEACLVAGVCHNSTMPEGAKFTALHMAANRGHAGVVACLVEAGADAGRANDYGVTPLFSAASSGHIAVVKLLSEKLGDDCTKPNTDASMPIHGAAQNGRAECVSELLKGGGAGSVNSADGMGRTALLLSAEEGHDDVIHALISGGADANKKDMYDRTPLSLACEACLWPTVTLLLDSGATTVGGDDAATAGAMSEAALGDEQSALAERLAALVTI